MAKAIKQIKRIQVSEEEKRANDLKEIEDALIENKDALLETLNVVGGMKERGILTLLNGMFGEGDRVLKVIVDLLNVPENTTALKNLMLLFGAAGKINVQDLEPLLLKVNAGIENVAEHSEGMEKTGYFDLLRALKDPEINRSLTILMTFLKGMGKDTENEEKVNDKSRTSEMRQDI
ncbi:DUF1641 domain-containing protein [Bacillus hwajinpoensis]|uniref:DUF1641 domain-containing protein n=1 Tax=Guptibacillus hwajinpoensis TaxID=208199 RepID=A0A845EVF9_9BACL|nr:MULTISPECIES: DUF1641 domain-containing protein [Bacillaceae]MCA0991581.1 DUF1641 domain-containing protein [Pseudalkalibacillus hwajinpoensis]MYL61998.1 DUF1641 domain-containing protein [Pseudalkalibacillus hwajinpoensis]PFG14862.1 uncharacterized protein YjgD (DUF1641 family) [Bacillus sp. es.036]